MMAVQTWLCSQDPLMASSASTMLPLCGVSQQDWSLGSVLGISDGFSQSPLLQHLPISHSHFFISEIEKQRAEMDWFLHSENQKLREMIMEEQSRQQSMLLQSYESRIRGLMRQRDADIAIARNKTRELQDLMIGAEVEAKLWEKRAIENEAIVTELSNKLNQIKESNTLLPNSNSNAQDAESSTSSAEHHQKICLACKMCQTRSLSVVFLPCRHLCCCKSCDAVLVLCPVCNAVKEDSVEAIIM